MKDMSETCPIINTIKDFERGGIGQVAESKNLFAKEVFFPHPKDIEFIKDLEAIAEEDGPFIISLVGIPGVGKTCLLLTLVRDKLPISLESYTERNLWKNVRKKFDFRKMDSKARQEHAGKVVWLVPTIDRYYSPTTKTLGRFHYDVEECVKKGDSLIIAGNVGVLGREKGFPTILKEARKTLRRRNGKDVLAIRVPETGLWIKEYGGNPSLETDIKLFKNFSLEFLKFVLKHVKGCFNNSKASCKQRSPCRDFQNILNKLMEKLGDDKLFAQRVYDLLCALRLNHHDIYLTPRTLLSFWAYSLDNLWALCNKSKVDETGIFYSLYKSSLPSNYDYRRAVYEIYETGVDIYRSKEVDDLLLHVCEDLYDVESRSKKRLFIYFKSQIENPVGMIYNGVYSIFLDDNLSRRVINEAFKHFFKYRDDNFQRSDIDFENTWTAYTFNICGTRGRKRVYATNKNSIEEMVYINWPLEVGPIDFQMSQARKVELRLRIQTPKNVPSPFFIVDMDVFWAFLRLYQGFQVDLSIFPHISVKIEKFLSDVEELSFPLICDFFDHKGQDELMMRDNQYIIDGELQ
jgi:hypothetical protein